MTVKKLSGTSSVFLVLELLKDEIESFMKNLVSRKTRSWFDSWRDAALYNKKQVWSVYICTTNVFRKLKFTKLQYHI